MRFGVHVSIAKGLIKAAQTARDLGCGCFQMFSSNPLGRGEAELKEKEIEEFKKFAGQKFGLEHFYIHTPYYVNLASPNPKIWRASVAAVAKNLNKAARLGGFFVVTHVGSHMGQGKAQGIKKIIEGLNEIFPQTPTKTVLALEVTAGAGTQIGSRFEEMAEIIAAVDKKSRIGICLDTAHVFAAGYDLKNKEAVEKTLQKFEKNIGLKYLKLIHTNDSKAELGNHIDRHEHIGRGKIGMEGFLALVNDKRLKDLDFILETPKKSLDDDRRNLEVLRSLK